jgi:DNA replication initiation complex subunit (GINS family)
MESTSTIERLRQALESEEASDTLTTMPPDAYIKLANYAQKLRASTGSGNDDTFGRLAKKQLWLIEAMTRRLLQIRLAKAQKEAIHPDEKPAPSSKNLLPEEQYVNNVLRQLTRKEERFVRAVVDGQPSFFTLVQRRETQGMMTVRISKRVGEIIGADLKRYGPFEVNDVARLPVGNAQVMVASKQAAPVSSDDY